MLFSHSGRSPSLLLPPNHLLFALNVSRLIVGLIHDPVVMFEEDNEVSPLKTFLPTTPAPTAVRQMYANPGNIPELVAILRRPDVSPNSQLGVINVSTMPPRQNAETSHASPQEITCRAYRATT